MLVDTHCHLTFKELAPRATAVLERAQAAGVDRVLTVTMNPSDWEAGLELAARFDNRVAQEAHRPLAGERPWSRVYVVAGIHPHEAARCGSEDLEALAALHRNSGPSGPGRLVAVGETGLDFHHQFAPRDRQEEVFRFQLALAGELRRPVVIHARQAEQRVCDILSDYPQLDGHVVFHCYSAGVEMARTILDRGFSLSFTGVVTFRGADRLRAAARYVPLERLMVETDAPFLTPEPLRGRCANEPALLVHTARFLAELRGEPYERFAAATTRNAISFFGLPEDQV